MLAPAPSLLRVRVPLASSDCIWSSLPVSASRASTHVATFEVRGVCMHIFMCIHAHVHPCVLASISKRLCTYMSHMNMYMCMCSDMLGRILLHMRLWTCSCMRVCVCVCKSSMECMCTRACVGQAVRRGAWLCAISQLVACLGRLSAIMGCHIAAASEPGVGRCAPEAVSSLRHFPSPLAEESGVPGPHGEPERTGALGACSVVVDCLFASSPCLGYVELASLR